MNIPLAVRAAISLLCSLGLLLPPAAFGASPQPPGPPQVRPTLRVADAALGPCGTFRGKVVDAQGSPLPATRVVLVQQTGPVAETVTDGEGHFAVANLAPGTYLAAADAGIGAFRVWPEATAPPSARAEALIVSDGTLVRGQNGLYQWISEHFWLTSALVATAIAVPVALIAHDRESKSN
jgi:hypothetical protein